MYHHRGERCRGYEINTGEIIFETKFVSFLMQRVTKWRTWKNEDKGLRFLNNAMLLTMMSSDRPGPRKPYFRHFRQAFTT